MSSVREIRPLTRVEGHGRIAVFFAGKTVERVTLDLYEAPRLFEALLRGKHFSEVPEIVCRICSLCSTVHRLCALHAVEKAMNVQISEQTRLYRELILYGGHLQSHALHLYCLVLPDYFQTASVGGLAEVAPEELQRGLRLKAAGNLIQETVGGRLIHPVTLIPGGMGKPPNRDGLLKLQDALHGVLGDARQACEGFRSFQSSDEPLSSPLYLGVRSGDVPLWGERLTLASGETFAVDSYPDLLQEQPPPSGNAKVTLVNGMPPTVGALARLNLGLHLSPLAQTAFSENRLLLSGADMRANNLAQAVELVLVVERALAIVKTLLASDITRETPAKIEPRPGMGSAAIEAPRGVLIHSYGFDSRGICTSADVITPTALNQAAMERDLFTLAKRLEGADDATLTDMLERLARAYDPCISCAVHVVRV